MSFDQEQRSGASQIDCKMSVACKGSHRPPTLPVGIAELVAKRAQPFDDLNATAEYLFEDLFRM